MFKKIAIIALFLGVTAGLAYLLYRFFFGAPNAVTPPPTNGEVTTPGGLPSAGNGRPVGTDGGVTGSGSLPASGTVAPIASAGGGAVATATVFNGQASNPFMSVGGLNYYNADDNRFYRVTPDGQVQSLSSQSFPEAKEIAWSPDGTHAAITFPDGSKVIYDFAAQRQVTLPSHWQDIGFNSDGSMIIAKSIGLDPASRWLISAASDGSSAKLIEPLGENGDKVTISVSPDMSVVAFSDTADPVGFDTRDMLVIGQNHENFPAVRVEGLDFEPKWSPDGKRLVYSAAGQVSGFKPMLWIVDGSDKTIGNGRRSLGLNTWAEKCVFQGSDTLYCAVPNTLPDGAGLERDIADTIPDSIVKVDLTSGAATLLGAPEHPTAMKSLNVSPDGSKLYYLDVNGSLQVMRLR